MNSSLFTRLFTNSNVSFVSFDRGGGGGVKTREPGKHTKNSNRMIIVATPSGK